MCVRTALDFQPLADRLPTAVAQGVGELLQPGPRRADDVARTAFFQPVECRLADHAAIQDPDASAAAVTGFHAGDDFPDGGAIVAVAGEDLVAERIAVARHHQTDEHLLAVGPMVARVAAPGLRIGSGLALKVSAGDVVQEQVVFQVEQRAQSFFQVFFQSFLVRQQVIEGAIEAVVIHLGVGDAQQVAQGGPAEPVLGDVQFTGRLTQPSDDQDGHHACPGNFRRGASNKARQQLIQTDGLPQAPGEPNVPEPSAPLQAEAAQIDGDGLLGQGGVEESGLPFEADDGFGQRRARTRPWASSSPSCATVSCRTLLPTRTERTSRQ